MKVDTLCVSLPPNYPPDSQPFLSCEGDVQWQCSLLFTRCGGEEGGGEEEEGGEQGDKEQRGNSTHRVLAGKAARTELY